VADRISDLKLLLIWPAYVVFCGLVTGYFAARVSKTPQIQTKSCLAACAFGNSTGLVITLLTVVHKQFIGSGAEIGRIDPTTFLSVYLLLYPVLQWGVGGWLLAPDETKEDKDPVENIDINATVKTSNVDNMENGDGEGGLVLMNELLSRTNIRSSQTDHSTPTRQHTRSKSITIDHILNHEPERSYSAALAAVETEFGGLSPLKKIVVTRNEDKSSTNALKMMVKELSFTSFDRFNFEEAALQTASRSTSPTTYQQHDDPPMMEGGPSSTSLSSLRNVSPPTINEHTPFIITSTVAQELQDSDIMPLTTTLLRISRKVFQPPVIASIAGLFIASFPSIRGLLVNIWGSNGNPAPLQWMFDGIYSVGQAAVPINMVSWLVLRKQFFREYVTNFFCCSALHPHPQTILGINLSSTFKKKSKEEQEKEKAKLLPNRTMLAIVVGKMIVMPVVGIISTWFLQKYYIDFPDEIDATCYLVMMIVFITPTANNVMVMVELSGSSSKESMARVIGYQYLVSPVVLSIVLAIVVSLASCHFDASPVCAI
jgi:predicted permease